jgi:hypothetical protein
MSNTALATIEQSTAITIPSAGELNSYSQMAKFLVAGRVYPGIDNEAKAVTLMLTAQSMGLHPMEAIRGIDLIQGRPVLKPQLMGALIIKAGHPAYEVEKNDGKVCSIRFYRKDKPRDWSKTVDYTLEEATAAGVAGKDVWKRHGADMLFNRCLGRGARQIYPEIFFGMYAVGEIQEDDQPQQQPTAPVTVEAKIIQHPATQQQPTKANGAQAMHDQRAEYLQREAIAAIVESAASIKTLDESPDGITTKWREITKEQFLGALKELSGYIVPQEAAKYYGINSFSEVAKVYAPNARSAGQQLSAALHWIAEQETKRNNEVEEALDRDEKFLASDAAIEEAVSEEF